MIYRDIDMNDHESSKDKECNMKGCIINSDIE